MKKAADDDLTVSKLSLDWQFDGNLFKKIPMWHTYDSLCVQRLEEDASKFIESYSEGYCHNWQKCAVSDGNRFR